jgi:hypothetical protein
MYIRTTSIHVVTITYVVFIVHAFVTVCARAYLWTDSLLIWWEHTSSPQKLKELRTFHVYAPHARAWAVCARVLTTCACVHSYIFWTDSFQIWWENTIDEHNLHGLRTFYVPPPHARNMRMYFSFAYLSTNSLKTWWASYRSQKYYRLYITYLQRAPLYLHASFNWVSPNGVQPRRTRHILCIIAPDNSTVRLSNISNNTCFIWNQLNTNWCPRYSQRLGRCCTFQYGL